MKNNSNIKENENIIMLLEFRYKPYLPPTASATIDLIIESGERQLFKHYNVFTVNENLQVIEVLGKYSVNEIHVHEKIAGHGDPVMMIKRGEFHTWENRWFTHDRAEAELCAINQINECLEKIEAEKDKLNFLLLSIMAEPEED